MNSYLYDPVDSHEEEELGGNVVVTDPGQAVLPGPAGELDQEAAEHDEVGDEEDDDDQVEIQEFRLILGQIAGGGANPK